MNNIIDTFLFFNEIELVKARLEYLGPYIKHFYIVESNIDFSGKAKPYYLKDELKHLPFAEKISYQPLEINLQSMAWRYRALRYRNQRARYLWKIQNEQRNAISKMLRTASIDISLINFVLFGDLDEFPSIQLLENLIAGNIELKSPHTLRQKLFYYRPNIAEKNETWAGTLCCPMQTFKQHQAHEWRSLREKLPYIEGGGYHFSYFMSPTKIQEKMNAIVEVEKLESFGNMSIENIQKLIQSQQDLYGRKMEFELQPEVLPEDLKRILEKNLPHLM
jgi:beta-1,4-mannosyl-glycoprotein beta-1,4-N-acetylglucosaminyltransferase